MLKACQADSRRQRNPTRHNQTAASERHGPQLEGRRSRRHWSAGKCAPRRRCSEGIARIPLSVSRRIGNRTRVKAMEIERTTFGTITIDGKTYEHDVIIRLSGEVVKRKKKLSKKYYGTSHVLSMDEAKFVYEDGCEQLILGSGQMDNVHLSPEAETYFAKKGCTVLLQPTPRAIHTFNNSHAKKIGLFHITC